MNFYDALQADPMILKQKIAGASEKREKIWFISAIAVRAALLAAFAVAVISLLNLLFGSENSNMAVVVFCIFLCIRFVDFDYCVRDSLVNLAVIFLILYLSPLAVRQAPPPLAFFINFISIGVILLIACEKPEMGNGGLYMFGYLFLTGTGVNEKAFIQRGAMTVVCFVVCAVLFYYKHRRKNKQKRFLDILKGVRLSDEKRMWQFRAALGISVFYFAGTLLGLPRLMWAAFACSSLLTAYSGRLKERAKDRIIGAVGGTGLFYMIWHLIPQSISSLLGIFSGLCLGFCGTYRAKTIFNCLGALMAAVGIYGLTEASGIRIFNNIAGVIFACAFVWVWEKAAVWISSFLEGTRLRQRAE